MNPDPRYERFGWDYAHLNPLSPASVAWHRGHIRAAGGPVLELACGTGRLLGALADEDTQLLGVDRSPTMLRLAQENRARLEPRMRRRVHLLRADMTALALNARFGVIILADNSLAVLETEADQIACLRGVRAHLRPGGRGLITMRFFNPGAVPGKGRGLQWSEPCVHPESGERVQRRVELVADPTEHPRRIVVRMVYRIEAPDGAIRTETCPFRYPSMTPEACLARIRQAGLEAEVTSGYGEASSPLMGLVCRPIGGVRA